MPEQHADNYNTNELEQLFPGQVFELDPEIGFVQNSDIDREKTAPTPISRQLIFPVGISILMHLCLLILIRQLMISTNSTIPEPGLRPPSIQISFRPRPAPETAPTPETAQPEETIINEQLLVNEETTPPLQPEQQPASQESAAPAPTRTAAITQSPRLVAPALLDVRELIQNRAQDNETRTIYNSIDCDERQRRNDLIDCGDEDLNAQYNFAAAEQNATVEFFAELLTDRNEDTSNQPADRTNTTARTRAAQENMTGNLGANPLIRSVMNPR